MVVPWIDGREESQTESEDETTTQNDKDDDEGDEDQDEPSSADEEDAEEIIDTEQPSMKPTLIPSPEPTPSPSFSPTIARIYDVHGCCLSCGQMYCSGSHACISAGSTCASMGSFKVEDGDCSFTYSTGADSYKFTYDLAPYMRSYTDTEKYYVVVDTTSYDQYSTGDGSDDDAVSSKKIVPKNQASIINAVQKVSYYFNLCREVRAKDLPYVCRTTTGYDGERCNADAMAYQYIIAPKALYDDDRHKHYRDRKLANGDTVVHTATDEEEGEGRPAHRVQSKPTEQAASLLHQQGGNKGWLLEQKIWRALSVPSSSTSSSSSSSSTWWHLTAAADGDRRHLGSSPMVEIAESCSRLSSCVDDAPGDDDGLLVGLTVELGLLNTLKPASGVVLKYLGGNSCPPLSTSSTDRGEAFEVPCAKSFKININCHNEIDQIPDNVEVTESTRYMYEMTINHIMGCPVECPRSPYSGRVCGSRGICFYAGYDGGQTADLMLSSPLTCLCQEGYYGRACEVTGYLAGVSYNTGYSTVSIILACLFVLLLIVLLILSNCERLILISQAMFGRMMGNSGLYSAIPSFSEKSAGSAGGNSGKLFGGIFSSISAGGIYEWSKSDLEEDEEEDEEDALLGDSLSVAAGSVSSVTMVARHDRGLGLDEDVEAFYRDGDNDAASKLRGKDKGKDKGKDRSQTADTPSLTAPVVDDAALLQQINSGSGPRPGPAYPGAASRSSTGGSSISIGSSSDADLLGRVGATFDDDADLLRAVNGGGSSGGNGQGQAKGKAQGGERGPVTEGAGPGPGSKGMGKRNISNERFVTKAPAGTPAASLAAVLTDGSKL